MRTAYNEQSLYNLMVVKEARQWWKHGLMDQPQFQAISEAYKNPLYHPNLTIRLLLFCATLLALSGASGFFFLVFNEIGVEGISAAAVIYGIASFFFLQRIFIKSAHHYKSGVTEALLYHAIGFTIGGLSSLFRFETNGLLWICLLVFSFTSFRYLDLLCTLSGILSLAGVLFFEFYGLGGIFQQIIPFVFIAFFLPVYFLTKTIKKRKTFYVWTNVLLVIESVNLLLIYFAGNYLVVRELSINMMQLELAEGEDIPFAFIFYSLTALIPLVYLYFGIKNKDVVLLRVSLVLIAISVFTFKYYYGFGHPEITLTLAGAILLIISIGLFKYLKVVRYGFTRENILSEKWGDANIAAFVVSQTMGGNQVKVDDSFKGGWGEFGGGGATGDF